MASPDDETDNNASIIPARRISNILYNNNCNENGGPITQAMDNDSNLGRNRHNADHSDDDLENDEVRTEQDEEDSETNVDTTDAAGTADGDDAEDGMYDVTDEQENGGANDINQDEDSDVREGDEEATSQDDEIMEEEAPTNTQSAVSAPASGTDTVPQYSTRGRHHSRETDADVLRDKLPDEGEVEPRPVGASFLDSLGEDERRTRTRVLPNVDGFHALFKAEVKHDLLLARTHMSPTGISTKLNAKSQNKNRREEDDVDANDEEEQFGPSEDERMVPEDAVSAVPTALDQTSLIPSRAFVVPPEEDAEISPHIVETVTAFNPPLPPESAGPKKKHRMMRWERQPADVETDLNSYRKTVTRTRQELIDAQAERERMETVSAHLRAHFLAQVKGLEQEGALLNDEFNALQLACIKAADLLQSRTRSRGVGKGSYVMRDVLHVLKQKGTEIANLPVKDDPLVEEQTAAGIGGIPAKSFMDWERGLKIEPEKPASGWILPGQAVQTPYGSGQVLHVFAPCELDVAEAPVAGSVRTTAPLKTARHGFGHSDAPVTGVANGDSKVGGVGSKRIDKKNPKKNYPADKKGESDNKAPVMPGKVDGLLAPRACVKLPFGVGFFSLGSLSCKDDISSYSDAMLVSRWKNMVETALSVAGCIDLAAMANYGATPPVSNPKTEPKTDTSDEGGSNDVRDKVPTRIKETPSAFMPFGSNMMPTSAGRAVRMADIPIVSLELGLNSSLLENCAILGKIENKGVPAKFREWEDIRDELSLLRAQVLQRRNELARQRRLRVMNERALATTTDKATRVENLVSEMRADLKSLKDRLDYELIELGEFHYLPLTLLAVC